MVKIGVTRSPDKEVENRQGAGRDKAVATSSSPSLLAAMKAVYWKFGTDQWHYQGALKAWHAFLDKTDFEVRGIDDKKAAAMRNCRPFGVKRTTNHFHCHETRLCPFCYGRQVVMPLANAAERWLLRNTDPTYCLVSRVITSPLIRLDGRHLALDYLPGQLEAVLTGGPTRTFRGKYFAHSAASAIVFGTKASDDPASKHRESLVARTVLIAGMPRYLAEKYEPPAGGRFEVYADKLPEFIGRAAAFDKTLYAVPQEAVWLAAASGTGRKFLRTDGLFRGKAR